jgi:hypothetical protein
MPRRRSLALGLALVGSGALLGYLAAAGAVGSGASRPEPGARPVAVASRPATSAQAAAAGLGRVEAKARSGVQTVKTRISRHAIKTKPKQGSFIGLTCPQGFTAISGGAITGYTNLVISHSAPIKPTPGHQRYTPRTWWVAVTNVGLDQSVTPLPWRPVVNCVNRIRVGR